MTTPSAAPRTAATAIATLRPVDRPPEDDLLAELAESAVPAEEDEVAVLVVLGAIDVVIRLVLVLPSEVIMLVMVLLEGDCVVEDDEAETAVDEGLVLVVEGLGDAESGTLLYIVV